MFLSCNSHYFDWKQQECPNYHMSRRACNWLLPAKGKFISLLLCPAGVIAKSSSSSNIFPRDASTTQQSTNGCLCLCSKLFSSVTCFFTWLYFTPFLWFADICINGKPFLSLICWKFQCVLMCLRYPQENILKSI